MGAGRRTRSCHSELRSADSVNRPEERERDRARGRRAGCGRHKNDSRSVCGPDFIKGISEAEISCAIPHPIPIRRAIDGGGAAVALVVLDSGKALATALLLVGFAT